MIRLKSLQSGLAFAALFLFALPAFTQVFCTPDNKSRCENLLSDLQKENWQNLPIHAVATSIGQRFLGTPYVAKTLEIEGEEQLVVELSGLDCTTFLENIVVFSRLARQNRLNYDDYLAELEHLRYRNGKEEGYPSRLHYFSDWIYQNAQKGIVEDVTQACGGQPYVKPIQFMSTHTSAYRQLADPSFVKEIQATEKEISARNYYYIPKAEIARNQDKIHSGDLIAITTSIAGLDIVHVGVAVKQNGQTHLLHASTGSMKVEVSEKTLSDYLAGNKSQSGIMVCRLKEI
ncbi:MAG: DUF1460 domain-containing protein [Bacteroidia bacterium]